MLHAGLDLSRGRLDVCLLDEAGNHLDRLVCAPDGEALKSFAGRVDELHGGAVSAVIESITGARFVHDTFECCGWQVEIADAQKVKGLARLACKTDRVDSLVLATLSQRDLVPSVWLPDPRVREQRELARFRLQPGQAQVAAQEPRSLLADQLRQTLPSQRPVRSRGPQAARGDRDPRALAR